MYFHRASCVIQLPTKPGVFTVKSAFVFILFGAHVFSPHMSKKQSNNWEQICIWWWSTHPLWKSKMCRYFTILALRLFPPWYPRWKELSNLSSRIFFKVTFHWIDSFGRKVTCHCDIDEQWYVYRIYVEWMAKTTAKCLNTMPWKVSLKLSIQSLSIRRAITVCQTLIDQVQKLKYWARLFYQGAWRLPSL